MKLNKDNWSTTNRWDTGYSPFFDQEAPEVEVKGMIASLDISQPYELDAVAIFKATGHGYLVVSVSGCSCWPDRGGTSQEYCSTKKKAEDAIKTLGWSGSFLPLLEKVQLVGWKVPLDKN